jgi:hypothetical protein
VAADPGLHRHRHQPRNPSRRSSNHPGALRQARTRHADTHRPAPPQQERRRPAIHPDPRADDTRAAGGLSNRSSQFSPPPRFRAHADERSPERSGRASNRACRRVARRDVVAIAAAMPDSPSPAPDQLRCTPRLLAPHSIALGLTLNKSKPQGPNLKFLPRFQRSLVRYKFLLHVCSISTADIDNGKTHTSPINYCVPS